MKMYKVMQIAATVTIVCIPLMLVVGVLGANKLALVLGIAGGAGFVTCMLACVWSL